VHQGIIHIEIMVGYGSMGARFPEMKVLIQQRSTKQFYQRNGKWTEKREEADTFSSSIEATQICRSKRLQADIVLAFRNPIYDVRIPCGAEN
jgi:hypothetical protein